MYKKILFTTLLCFLFVPKAFCLSAQSAILIDGHTGRVLLDQNAYQRRGMASTTKIMTAIIAVEQGNPTDIVTVSYKAANVEGSSMWLKSGEKIPLSSLIYGLMLNSGNDAATAIAEHIGGSVDGFAELMNKKAKELCLDNTSFTNPHGLDNDNHYTTAFDLAQLTRYALNNKTFAEIVATKSKRLSSGEEINRSLRNHNKMLTLYDDADGVKTGFTKKSGRCLVSSATRDGLRLISVTLNAPDDWNDHTEMLNYGFSKYSKKVLLNEGDFLKTVAVNNGTEKTVSVYAENNLEVAVTSEEEKGLKTVYNIVDNTNAPVIMGQKMGSIEVYLDDKTIASCSSITKNGVESFIKSGFIDKLTYLIYELLSNFQNAF